MTYLNKKVYAYDPHGLKSYRCIGIIAAIDKSTVIIFNTHNPSGYKTYKINRVDFDNWIKEQKYKLRSI